MVEKGLLWEWVPSQTFQAKEESLAEIKELSHTSFIKRLPCIIKGLYL